MKGQGKGGYNCFRLIFNVSSYLGVDKREIFKDKVR